jgi:hypothetical protein
LIENARPQDLTLDGNKRRVAINLELANLARLNLLVNLLNSKHIRVFSRALLQACCCRRVEKPFEPLGMSLPCVFDGAINPYERVFDRGRHCRREVVESACERVSVYCPNAGIAGQMAAILCIGEHVWRSNVGRSILYSCPSATRITAVRTGKSAGCQSCCTFRSFLD